MAGPGANVRVAVEPIREMLKETSGWLETSLAGRTLMAVMKLLIVWSATSSLTVGGLAASVNVGGSLTGVTVMGTVVTVVSGPPLPKLPRSLVVMVRVSGPL